MNEIILYDYLKLTKWSVTFRKKKKYSRLSQGNVKKK